MKNVKKGCIVPDRLLAPITKNPPAGQEEERHERKPLGVGEGLELEKGITKRKTPNKHKQN